MKRLLLTAAISIATLSGAAADALFSSKPYQVAQNVCGFYIVLGCGQSQGPLLAKRDSFGGPNAGGGAGLRVANTNQYPNFRNGFYCLVDGPYPTFDDASSVAWAEAVPDAYVKNGC